MKVEAWDKKNEFGSHLEECLKRATEKKLQLIAALAVDHEMQFYKHISIMLDKRFDKEESPKGRLNVLYIISEILRLSHKQLGTKDKYAERMLTFLPKILKTVSSISEEYQVKVKKLLRLWHFESIYTPSRVLELEKALQATILVEQPNTRPLDQRDKPNGMNTVALVLQEEAHLGAQKKVSTHEDTLQRAFEANGSKLFHSEVNQANAASDEYDIFSAHNSDYVQQVALPDRFDNRMPDSKLQEPVQNAVPISALRRPPSSNAAPGKIPTLMGSVQSDVNTLAQDAWQKPISFPSVQEQQFRESSIQGNQRPEVLDSTKQLHVQHPSAPPHTSALVTSNATSEFSNQQGLTFSQNSSQLKSPLSINWQHIASLNNIEPRRDIAGLQQTLEFPSTSSQPALQAQGQAQTDSNRGPRKRRWEPAESNDQMASEMETQGLSAHSFLSLAESYSEFMSQPPLPIGPPPPPHLCIRQDSPEFSNGLPPLPPSDEYIRESSVSNDSSERGGWVEVASLPPLPEPASKPKSAVSGLDKQGKEATNKFVRPEPKVAEETDSPFSFDPDDEGRESSAEPDGLPNDLIGGSEFAYQEVDRQHDFSKDDLVEDTWF